MPAACISARGSRAMPLLYTGFFLGLRPMKKGFAFCFLAILLLNTFGYLISFSIELLVVKQSAGQKLKTGETGQARLFIFTPVQFTALTHGDNGTEFNFDGFRYDVAHIQKKQGLLYVSAICDEQETDLLESFIALFTRQSNQAGAKQVIPAFTLLEFITTTLTWQYNVPVRQLAFFAPGKSTLLSVSLSTSSPPPDSNFF